MYFPLGWPKYLQCPGYAKTPPKYVFCNHDRSLFALLTDDSIAIWYPKPCVQIVCYTRSPESLLKFGTNLTAEWKPDSSMIVVVTSNNFLIFHRVEVDSSLECLYEQKDSNVPSLRRESAELFIKERVLPLTIVPSFSVSLEGTINRLIGAEEELVVATDSGFLCGINWDGSFDQGFMLNLRCLSFSANQAHLQGVHADLKDLNVVDLAYSSLIDGFSVVFSDGKAAFISLSADIQKSHVYGIWATEISGAVCTAVNHKYQLLAYGLKSAEGAVYSVADPNGAFQLTHRLVLSSKTFQDAARMAGPVTSLCWTPDGTALAMAWEKGGLSLWSVFGALLMCTLSWDYGSTDVLKNNPFHISSMIWGKEGYNLWFTVRQSQMSVEDNRKYASSLAQMPFAKSALTTNPSMVGCECVLLQSEDRLFVSAGGDLLRQPHPYSEAVCSQDFVFINGNDCDDERPSIVETPSLAVGNKQWIIVPIPHTYLGTNWPIRYAALDQRGQHVAVAGRCGLAHYSFHQRRWKLFGNETQEKDFEVKGGLLWWKDYIVLGCYNHLDSRDEIRLYPQKMKLDNQFVRVAKVSFEVMQLSIFRDRLLVLLADSSLMLFGFQQNSPKSSTPHIICLQQIHIPNLVFLPESVISVTLAALQTERGKWVAKDAESILMNVCGRLFLIQKDVSNKHNDGQNNNNKSSPSVYNAISIIASCVESMWASSTCCQSKPHLTEALWLSCGVGGMQVWLPLFPREGEVPRAHNFMSKRIMLPVQSHIYPLAVLFEDAVVLGAENDTVLCGKNSAALPFSIVSRTSQVYLHHILRELLRRNLGYHAWEIAQSCSCLPYFPHSLELLLHEVLEEEATSSQPIPDALLPRVIDFIREFPMFLQTVVQCARKTELALWPYLFAAVGNPKDLFQDCLHQGLLETAASYLIILQNLEKASVSRQYATLLLDSALYSCKWQLAKDLVRFLTAIDPSDVETPPRASLSVGPPNKYCISHSNVMASTPPADDDTQSIGTVSFSRKRSQSSSTAPFLANASSTAENSTTYNQNIMLQKESGRTASEPRLIPRKRYSVSQKDKVTAEEFFIDTVLARHARRLLADGQLKELGFFSAHLDFYLVSFLKRERSRAGKVEDIVHALRKLHEDFQWPFPFASLTSFSLLAKDNSGSSMQSGGTLNYGQEDPLHPSDIPCSVTTQSQPDVGDSGYLSHNAQGANNYPMPLGVSSLGNGDNYPVEAQLLPRTHQDDGSLLTLDMSEDSSLWEDDRSMLDDDRWTGGPLVADLENLTLEMASKGNPKSEVQLRYLLQITLEAGCLDWSFLIAMVLRDTLAVMRVVNAARQPELPQDNVHHLLQNIATLDQWVLSECLGYRPFMLAIRNQVKILARIATSKPQMLKLQGTSVENSRENSISQEDPESPLPSVKSKNPIVATPQVGDNPTNLACEDKVSHGSDDVFGSPMAVTSDEITKTQSKSEEKELSERGEDGKEDDDGWSNQCCIS